MQHIRLTLFPLVVLSLILLSCGTDTPYGVRGPAEATLRLNFAPVVDGQAFSTSQTYQSPTNRDYRFTLYRFYLSDIRLVRADNTEDTLFSTILVDLTENEIFTPEGPVSGLNLPVDIQATSYEGIRFNLGVAPDVNLGNPAVFPSNHPLSINRGMHWSWSTGYIFMQVEGRYDSTDQNLGDLSQDFLYHPGRNELLRSQSFELSFAPGANQTVDGRIQLDLARTFYGAGDPIDIAADNFTHSTPPDGLILAERVMDHLDAGAFSVQF